MAESGDNSFSSGVTQSATSMSSVFAEHEIAYQKIDILIQNGLSTAEMDEALGHLRCIFDKYLELPSLLDKYVVAMVQRLTSAAKEIMKDATIINASEFFWLSALPRQLSTIYALSKVRGRKRIQKLLPHGVEDVHIVIRTLQALYRISCAENNSEDAPKGMTGQPHLWESLYVLWSWMGILSLIPFHSSIVVAREDIDAMVEMAKASLTEAGPTREMAAACLASWLSRPDLETTHLEAFREWAESVLKNYSEHAGDIIQVLGILQVLVSILKISTSDRDSLLRFVTPLADTMMQISYSKPNNLLMRKYLIKWWTRTATLHMPPRIATWRYQRGKRSIKENLIRGAYQGSAYDENNQAKALSFKSIHEYELFVVPDPVEDAMGEIIAGLTDSSTIVRWSAAKGVGRITERLPAICSDDVLDAVLDLYADQEQDNDWQGACLALAELSRRGLLLPHRLEEVIAKVAEAIHVSHLTMGFL